MLTAAMALISGVSHLRQECLGSSDPPESPVRLDSAIEFSGTGRHMVWGIQTGQEAGHAIGGVLTGAWKAI